MGNTDFLSVLFFMNSYFSLHICFLFPLHLSAINPSTHVHSTCQIISVITLHKRLLQEIREKKPENHDDTHLLLTLLLSLSCSMLSYCRGVLTLPLSHGPVCNVMYHSMHAVVGRLFMKKMASGKRRTRQERWKALPRWVVEVQPLPPHCCFHSTISSRAEPSLGSLHFFNQLVLLLDVFI